MQMNPYLFFDGQCKAAFDFYAQCFEGSLQFSMKYGDSPECEGLDAAARERIMHTTLRMGESLLMGSDCPPGRYEKPQGISIALDYATPEKAEQVFAQLSDQGQVHMQMAQTFWATKFGMATDRFGISWMVSCNQSPEAT